MNGNEAKQILLRYQPDRSLGPEPEMDEALALTQADPELKKWFENHCAVQLALRNKFREIPVPSDLRQRILAQHPVMLHQPSIRWSRAAWIAAAAAVLLLAGVSSLWLKPRTPNQFADYESRMVRTAVREYRMDILTNNMAVVRQFMAEKGAPADYTLPAGLERLTLTGGGLLRWRGNPVSMVCFNRGDDQMLFLFVMKRSAVPDPPPTVPRFSKVSSLVTASWSQSDRTYVLAGQEENDFERKYLAGEK